MKKNVMMRIASILLVCVLASTCGISGTFAKYVTEGTSTDTARVAMWGVKIAGTADLFSDKYNEEDAQYSLSAESVISFYGDNVVAPGTTGTAADITLIGKPEVAARIEHKVSNIRFANWEIDHDGKPDTEAIFYCPLEFVVGTKLVLGVDYVGNEAGLINAIVEAVAAVHDVAPNTDLAGTIAEDLTIVWNWPYYVSDLYDKYDTILGDNAVTGSAATVTIDVTTTITQIN